MGLGCRVVLGCRSPEKVAPLFTAAGLQVPTALLPRGASDETVVFLATLS